MARFILCWYKTKVIEEVEAARVDKDWFAAVSHAQLDVLKIKDGKALILDSLGGWSRVKKRGQDENSH